MSHTSLYATLLQASLSPRYMLTSLGRSALFESLWKATRGNRLDALFRSEVEDLERLDIPLFSFQLGSQSLWDSTGTEFPDALPATPLSNLWQRLANWGAEDAGFQRQLIRWSLARGVKTWDLPALRLDLTPVQMEQEPRFLQVAEELGNEVLREAVWGEERATVTWTGIALDGQQWTVQNLDAGLYSGLGGMAICFASLNAAVPRRDFLQAARASWQSLLLLVQERPADLSVFSGSAGLLYVAAILSHLDPPQAQLYLKSALKELDRLEPLIEADERLDVIGGSAGALLAAVTLSQVLPGSAQQVLRFAHLCAAHILAHATAQERGVGWVPAVTREAGYAMIGMSHGASGIALALARLYALDPGPQLLNVIREALAYEELAFVPNEGNWSDFRYRDARLDQDIPNPVQWCHGAPGMALARLHIQRLTGLDFEQQLRVATETTVRAGWGGSHCLCHGDLGNLEVLLQQNRELEARAYGQALLDQVAQVGWRCGVPLNVQTPGLMVGRAGMIMGLLRLSCPEQMPDVLTLSLPEVWRRNASRPKETLAS